MAEWWADPDFKLTAQQQEVFDSPAQFRIVSANKGWGKTTLCEVELKRTMDKGGQCAFITAKGFGMDRVKDDIWRMLGHLESRQKYTGGAVSYLTSCEQGFGQQFDLVVMDEAALLDGAQFNYDDSMRLFCRPRCRALVVSTLIPIDQKVNWFTLLYEQVSRTNTSIWTAWTFKDVNSHLPDSFRDALKE